MVDKIATFPRLKEYLEKNEKTKFLRRLNREHLQFPEFKFLKETDKRVYTTADDKREI